MTQSQLPRELNHLVKNRFFKRSTAFKFVDRRFLDDILHGCIKIGSLSAFRNLESASLADSSEGTVVAMQRGTITADMIPENSVMRRVFNVPSDAHPEAVTFAADGAQFIANFDFPVFCFSYEKTLASLASIADTTNCYDAVVEITNLRAFADIIAKRLNTSYLCLPVHYCNPIRDALENGPSEIQRAFEKPLSFSPNAEGRIVFFAEEHKNGYAGVESSTGNIITLPALRSYLCEAKLPIA
jgi:hypothetical protein